MIEGDSGPGTLVKPAQSRRGLGKSEVYLGSGQRWGLPGQRVYTKVQSAYFCRPPWAGWRQVPTLRRECRALLAARLAGLNVPLVVHYEERNGDATLVLLEVPQALPLDEALHSGAKPPEALLAMAATCIAQLHRSGWVHGALYPAHILYSQLTEKMYLIDFEKARRNPLKRRSDLDRLWRRFEHLPSAERRLFEQSYRAALNARP